MGNLGKFDNDLDDALYRLSLDGGPDEEVGSSTEAPGTWAALMRDGKALAEAIRDSSDVHAEDADLEYLETEGAAGVILTESTQGFVEVKYYSKKSDLEKDWDECLEVLSMSEDDDEFEENHSHSATAWSRDSDKWFDEVAAGWKKYQHDGGWRELHRIAGMSPTRPNFELFKKKAGGRLPSLTAFLEKMESGAYKGEFKKFAGTSRAAYGPRSVSQVSSLFDLFRQATEYAGNGAAKGSGYKVGDRVELHPGTDAWMRGDRYGDIVKVGRDKLHVKMDRSGRTLKMPPDRVAHVDMRSNGREGEDDEGGAARPTSIMERRKAGIVEGLTKAEMDSMEIRIPTFDWKQIGGDMNPGAYGGTIATADGDSIEVVEIQPVREHVGDREAQEIGHPFWSKSGYYDLDDLALSNQGVQSAIEFSGLGESLLDMTPEQRAVAIAEACVQAGHRYDEGPAGWAEDVLGGRVVEWWGGKKEDWHYLEDEDNEFRRDVLGEKYEVLVNGDGTEKFYEDEDDAISDTKERIERGLLVGRVEVVDTFDDEVIWSSEQPDEETDPSDFGKLEPNAKRDRGVRHDGKPARGRSGDPRTWPKSKFQYDDIVVDPDRPDRQGKISYIGGYDEFHDGYAYKVLWPDGSRLYSDEASLRLVKRGKKHRKNASRPELESSGVLDQLIDMQAESLEPRGGGYVPPEVKNEFEVTDDLREVVSQYEDALREALEEVVEKFPPEDDATAFELFNNNAPYLVLMMLMGTGVGIGDGDWDSHYPDSGTTRAIGNLLKEKLGKYANDSGTGWIIEELETAVYEAMRRANYGFDEETYVPLEEGEDAGFEFSDTEIPPDRIAVIVDANGLPLDKFWDAAGGERSMTRGEADRLISKLGGKFARPYRKNPQARWHVFLNNELLETVYFDQDMSADDVKQALVNHDGFSSKIVVQQPPERRSRLPGHYRQGDHRANETLPDPVVGATYTYTNHNHIEGPLTFKAVVTGVHDRRVYYDLIPSGVKGVSPLAGDSAFTRIYTRVDDGDHRANGAKSGIGSKANEAATVANYAEKMTNDPEFCRLVYNLTGNAGGSRRSSQTRIAQDAVRLFEARGGRRPPAIQRP